MNIYRERKGKYKNGSLLSRRTAHKLVHLSKVTYEKCKLISPSVPSKVSEILGLFVELQLCFFREITLGKELL
jgi:hypothetical protein